jgi:hypothetical protein
MKRNHYPDLLWEKLKQDFCSGESTLRQAAEKHGVKFKAAETRARREGWKRQQNENLQIVKEIAGKAIQARSAELGERAAEFLGETTDQLKMLLADFKAKRGTAATFSEFESYVDSFATLVRTGQELYQLDQPAATQHLTLHLQSELAPVLPHQLPGSNDEIVEVETVTNPHHNS